MHLFHGQPLSRLQSDKCSACKISGKEKQNERGHSAAHNPRLPLLCCDLGKRGLHSSTPNLSYHARGLFHFRQTLTKSARVPSPNNIFQIKFVGIYISWEGRTKLEVGWPTPFSLGIRVSSMKLYSLPFSWTIT